MALLLTSRRWCKHACARRSWSFGKRIDSAADFEHSFLFSLAGRMGIRWLAVLCAWALLTQFSVSFPEEEFLEELELDEPEGKTHFF